MTHLLSRILRYLPICVLVPLLAGCLSFTSPSYNEPPTIMASAWTPNGQSFLTIANQYRSNGPQIVLTRWDPAGNKVSSQTISGTSGSTSAQPVFYPDDNHFFNPYSVGTVSLLDWSGTRIVDGERYISASPGGRVILTFDSAKQDLNPFHTVSVVDLRGTTPRIVMRKTYSFERTYYYYSSPLAFMLADDRWGMDMYDSNDDVHFTVFDTLGNILFATPGLTDPTRQAMYLAPSNSLVVSSYSTTSQFNLATGKRTDYEFTPNYSITDLQAPVDGRYIALLTRDGVHIINPATNAQSLIQGAFFQVRVTPDGNHAALIKNSQDVNIAPQMVAVTVP